MERKDITAIPQIRPARAEDASRIAEIWIFAKRAAYRSIFQNDQVSFGEMQVLPLALELRDREGMRQDLWVYEEGFVKGVVRCTGTAEETAEGAAEEMSEASGAEAGTADGALWISDLYVEPFFQGDGVGRALLEHCMAMAQGAGKQLRLWVLEKNGRARRFYEKNGFVMTGGRKEEAGTDEYLVEYEKEAANSLNT